MAFGAAGGAAPRLHACYATPGPQEEMETEDGPLELLQATTRTLAKERQRRHATIPLRTQGRHYPYSPSCASSSRPRCHAPLVHEYSRVRTCTTIWHGSSSSNKPNHHPRLCPTQRRTLFSLTLRRTVLQVACSRWCWETPAGSITGSTPPVARTPVVPPGAGSLAVAGGARDDVCTDLGDRGTVLLRVLRGVAGAKAARRAVFGFGFGFGLGAALAPAPPRGVREEDAAATPLPWADGAPSRQDGRCFERA